MRKLYDAQAKERRREAGKRGGEGGRGRKKTLPAIFPEGLSPAKGDARDKAADVVEVSGRAVDFATKVTPLRPASLSCTPALPINLGFVSEAVL
jgi:hypothetical protein